MRVLLLFLLLLLTACATPRDRVVLLPGDDTHALTVATARTTQTLTEPYATATVRPDGRVQPGMTTAAAVQRRFGAGLQTLPPAGRTYTLTFDASGSTRLRPESEGVVRDILADIAAHAASEVVIEGHTDTTGDLEANDRLSLERAEAVRALLVAAGLQSAFVRVVGRGEREPAVVTPDETDEPRNRRVEVIVR